MNQLIVRPSRCHVLWMLGTWWLFAEKWYLELRPLRRKTKVSHHLVLSVSIGTETSSGGFSRICCLRCRGARRADDASFVFPSGDSSKVVPGGYTAVWYDDDVWHHRLLLTPESSHSPD